MFQELRKKLCSHWQMRNSFVNLHTGADGEIYVRSLSECPDCGYKRANAVRLPQWVDKAIDRNKLDWSKNGSF